MPPSVFLFFADLVLFVHILVVAFVILGLMLTLLGWGLGWRWVRDLRFRSLHLLAILIVVAQAWAGQICPLTTLEVWLRQQGGEGGYAGSFISHWMQTLLYYDAPAWVFITAYSLFAFFVVLTWIFVRPEKRSSSR